MPAIGGCIQAEIRYSFSRNVLCSNWPYIFLFLSFVLAEQDAKLNQLRQTVEQIRQDKTKESERADKLAEELKGRFPQIGNDVVVLFCRDEPL